jgi:hypothetical protein
MKYEWKKQEKEYYLPKEVPTLVEVPKFKYFTIEGVGNPNKEEFAEKVGVLYSLSYAVKMMPKSGYTPEGYFDYTVYPLEGIWDLTEKGRKEDKINKDELVYKIMIKQPDFVNKDIYLKALETTKKKKPNILLDEIKFEEIQDGLSIQMLHIGSYDNEPETFRIMEEYMKEKGYTRKSQKHREIYLSDARKTSSDKLKTVLRFEVE